MPINIKLDPKEESELFRLAGSEQGKGIYFSILSSSLGSSPSLVAFLIAGQIKGAAEGFPGNRVVENPSVSAGDTRDMGLIPWLRKISWRRKWQPIPVFLPEIVHGQRSLAGYSPWDHKQSDMI